MSPLQEESGCEEDEGEDEEESREEEEAGFDSDESLVDSDSDSDEKGAFVAPWRDLELKSSQKHHTMLPCLLFADSVLIHLIKSIWHLNKVTFFFWNEENSKTLF